MFEEEGQQLCQRQDMLTKPDARASLSSKQAIGVADGEVGLLASTGESRIRSGLEWQQLPLR